VSETKLSTIQPSEVQWFLSAPNATSGYTVTSTPGNCFGKYMSTTQVNAATTTDNIFLDASGIMNANMEVDYACIFLANNTVTGFSMKNPVVWMPVQFAVNYTDTIQLGADPIGVVPQTSASQQAQLISAQNIAPAGVTTWAYPSTTLNTGVKVADIPPGYCVGIWFKRALTNVGPTPAGTPDGAGFTVSFQSSA
jgi:hypothetical protein